MYINNCPNCGSVRKYKHYSSYITSINKNSLCKTCSSFNHANKKNNIDFLMQESLESYYWLGFIFADGHISNGRLIIGLSKQDSNHLQKLADKLSCKLSIKNNKCSIGVMDKKKIKILVDKYNISNIKTYIPPNIYNITGDNLIAFKIGFIDGDGSIKNVYKRKDFNIIIKCHSNWKDNLLHMFGNAKINNSGYACSYITNTEHCKFLKEFAIKNNLPVLNRKWDIINLNFKSKVIISKERKEIIIQMLKENKSRKDMIKATNLSKSGLSVLIKKINLECRLKGECYAK